MKKDDSKKILNRCKKATLQMSKYPEVLTDEGIAEVLIFCVCYVLNEENDKCLMERVLTLLIWYISDDIKLNRSVLQVAKIVAMRSIDYPLIIQEIKDNPEEFDLNSLYCDMFRYPFTDVHYAVAGPKYPKLFRNVILKLLSRLS